MAYLIAGSLPSAQKYLLTYSKIHRVLCESITSTQLYKHFRALLSYSATRAQTGALFLNLYHFLMLYAFVNVWFPEYSSLQTAKVTCHIELSLGLYIAYWKKAKLFLAFLQW